jgi:hypothetical protein
MTLKSALENSIDQLRPLRRRPPDLRQFSRAVSQISDRGGLLGNAVSIMELQQNIIDSFNAGTLSTIKRRDLRHAPQAFFEGPRPLASQPALREAILGLIAANRQKSAVLAAIFQYLEWFNPTNTDLERVGVWLDGMVREWPWPWHDRAIRFRLFEVAEAPLRLAQAVLVSDALPNHVLAEIGLSEVIATGALGELTFAAACLLVSRSGQRDMVRLQERLIEWGKRGERFGFDKAFPLFVSALLDPWTSAEPTAEHQRRIMAELESFAGDPRVRPAKWSIVKDRAPAAYAILMRWLTKASVYQFFDIVDRVADRHMWSYRRAFWTAYLKAGHIEQAWVVFGSNGGRLARQMATSSGDKGLLYFGKLETGGGRSPDHAALVMNIGDLTIAEWSHNGKYNIWKRGQRGAPRLFLDRYHPDELRHAPIDGSHTSNDYFGWQQAVARIIRDETGLVTASSAWKPGKARP